MAVDWLGFGYAVLVTAGGIAGYYKAGEKQTIIQQDGDVNYGHVENFELVLVDYYSSCPVINS